MFAVIFKFLGSVIAFLVIDAALRAMGIIQDPVCQDSEQHNQRIKLSKIAAGSAEPDRQSENDSQS